MTQIQCDCGKFKAEINNFPKAAAGRCVCYCDDCQTFLHYLGKTNLMDSAGATEIIPVYPTDYKIVQGQEFLACIRLSEKGLFRWYTTCCNTPIGNVIPNFPWVGTINHVYNLKEPQFIEKTFGGIRSRIYGKYARGSTPAGTPDKMTFKNFMAVFPFVLKGFLTGKGKNSPFFGQDGKTPLATPKIMSLEERNTIRKKIGFTRI